MVADFATWELMALSTAAVLAEEERDERLSRRHLYRAVRRRPPYPEESRSAHQHGRRLGGRPRPRRESQAGRARAAGLRGAHRVAADRSANQRAAALLRLALSHAHRQAAAGRDLP